MSNVKISTTPEIPGHRITGYVDAVASIKADWGKQAENKANDAYTAAITDLSEYAERAGGNAVVGLQVPLVAPSAGGVMGDSFVALVVGTVVVVEPL